MKQIVALLSLWLFSTSVSASDIIKIEYFFNSDPGFGNGTDITIPSSDSIVDLNVTLPIENLEYGFNTAYFRALDDSGKWSLTYYRVFMKMNTIVEDKSINRIEYFINTDPGFGQGTPIAFSQTDEDISVDHTIDLSGLNPGFHNVYIRVRDNRGVWSITSRRIFYILKNESEKAISRIEYFINEDPGLGKGTALEFSEENGQVYIDYDVDLSGLNNGFHSLYIRAQDASGSWSITSKRAFFIKDQKSGLANITNIEYFFTNDEFHSDTLTAPVAVPAPSVDLEFTADISSLPPDQEYVMHVVAVNEDGERGLVQKKTIKACSTDPPRANFDFISVGNRVSFIDSSQFATNYYWDFGDGEVDSVSNPVHEYEEFGTYEVTMVASNFCRSDTISKLVNVLGVQSINPSKGGNTGEVTVTLTGGGFSEESIVKLINQSKEIIGTPPAVSDAGDILRTTFNLIEKEIGSYNVVVQTGSVTDTLQDAFDIEVGTEPDLSVDILGNEAIRRGRTGTYTVIYKNSGNIDSYFVPLSILFPKGVSANLNVDLMDLAQLDEVENKEEVRSTPAFIDLGDTIILSLIVPIIPANTEGSFTLDFSSLSGEDFWIESRVGSPLAVLNTSNNNSRTKSLDLNTTGCLSDAWGIALAVGGGVAVVANAPCVTSLAISSAGLFASYTGLVTSSRQLRKNFSWKNVGGLLISTTGFAVSVAGLGLSSGVCLANVPVGAAAGSFATVVTGLGLSAAGGFLSASNYHLNCAPTINSRRNIVSVNSFDPNEKVGPSNITAGNYTRGTNTFNYTVYFENVDTATAAAQEVYITDTLDLSVLDVTTFSLGEMAFGDTIVVTPPPGLQAYSSLVDLRPRTNLIVRIDAKLDKNTGIVRWHYISLDPETMELTDDPILGFLPPNKNPKEGEGHVSFSIRPKPDLANGTVIKNQASIVFDLNEPIITNQHINTIDILEPASAINQLEPVQEDSTFMVSWNGSDNDSGVRSYDVYVSEDEEAYQLWLYDIAENQSEFIGKNGSEYQFYSIAKDYAGNLEVFKTVADAETKIEVEVTALNEELDFPFAIYPNPTSGDIEVRFTIYKVKNIQLELLDLSGKRIRFVDSTEYLPGENTIEVDMLSLKNGVYFLKFVSDQQISTYKIIKR